MIDTDVILEQNEAIAALRKLAHEKAPHLINPAMTIGFSRWFYAHYYFEPPIYMESSIGS